MHGVLAANLSLLPSLGHSWLWKIKAVSVNEGLTLLVGLLAVVYARQQIAFGLQPHVVYEARFGEQPTIVGVGQDNGAPEEPFWQVKLVNAGAGAALLADAVYIAQFRGEPEPRELSYRALIAVLNEKGLTWGEDIVLSHLSSGYALGASREKDLLFLRASKYEEIQRLDIVIRYQSLLRDEFQKEVFAIPRVRQARLVLRKASA
jgi:hypothetical protein